MFKQISLRFILPLIMMAFAIGSAGAQTTPTANETQVGDACANAAHSFDFDTMVQCNSITATAGTMQKAPLFIGAVTTPPYGAVTCDAAKEGMIQYTGTELQFCNGTAWAAFGGSVTSASLGASCSGNDEGTSAYDSSEHLPLYCNNLSLWVAVGAFSGSEAFVYTGTQQTFTVPTGVTSITVDMAGAQGGMSAGASSTAGGLGGRTQTTLAITPGTVYNVYVGGEGLTGVTTALAGGWNGGGSSGGNCTSYCGGSGGGASDIRTGGALANRVVVAGGGGGSGHGTMVGGDGGEVGTNGEGWSTYTGGYGGTASAGGAGSTIVSAGTAGSIGTGGNGGPGNVSYYGGGGGAGGYYGGGGGGGGSGGAGNGGGGGGSSYSNGSGTSYTTGYQSGNGYVNISW